jgi:RimJ/RimL family protein N-acetyltransferase
MFKIRKAEMSDAEALCHFIKELDSQSEYILYDVGERRIDIESTKKYLDNSNNTPGSVVLIAENEISKIIGFACGEANTKNRSSHVTKANLGVLKSHRGTPVARQLLGELIQYLKNKKIVRIEASVIKNNIICLNLCKKFGFQIEGIKKLSIKIGGQFLDEYVIALLFNPCQ